MVKDSSISLACVDPGDAFVLWLYDLRVCDHETMLRKQAFVAEKCVALTTRDGLRQPFKVGLAAWGASDVRQESHKTSVLAPWEITLENNAWFIVTDRLHHRNRTLLDCL